MIEITIRRFDAVADDIETGTRVGSYDFQARRGTVRGEVRYELQYSEWEEWVA